MGRISLAFRSFFNILFQGELSAPVIQELGLSKAAKATPAAKPAPPPPQLKPSDGALQILGILQRDARLIDFLMEDISSYSDDQVGAAVRDLQKQSKDTLARYLQLIPVIDGVEGTPARIDGQLVKASEIKLLGNVPADGKAPSGTLRHKGWKAVKVDLPTLVPSQNPAVIAPAEIEIE